MRRTVTTCLAVVLVAMSTMAVVIGVTAAAGASTKAAKKSSSKSPITIGYITSVTGDASSTFTSGPGGAQAVVDEVNAKGGIHGHKLKLIVKNDDSTPTQYANAAKELVADGVTVVINYSSFGFAGEPYLEKAGIPVVGSAFTGPQWTTKSDTNLFTWAVPSESPIGGYLYTYTTLGKLLKDLHVASFGGLGYGISPSSTDSILEADTAVKDVGLKVCYTNNTITFGATTFTSDVLQIKAAHCGAVAGSFVESSDLGLSTDMKHAGLTKVKQIFFTGYDATTTKTASSRAGFDGDYAEAEVTFSPPNHGGDVLLSILKKYDHAYTGGIPAYGLLGSTISAQLVAYGLERAGANPTSASFAKALRKVKSWNDTGLLPTPAIFTGFGTLKMFPKTDCEYYEQLVGSTWKTFGNGPVCGTLVKSIKASTTS